MGGEIKQEASWETRKRAWGLQPPSFWEPGAEGTVDATPYRSGAEAVPSTGPGLCGRGESRAESLGHLP